MSYLIGTSACMRCVQSRGLHTSRLAVSDRLAGFSGSCQLHAVRHNPRADKPDIRVIHFPSLARHLARHRGSHIRNNLQYPIGSQASSGRRHSTDIAHRWVFWYCYTTMGNGPPGSAPIVGRIHEQWWLAKHRNCCHDRVTDSSDCSYRIRLFCSHV